MLKKITAVIVIAFSAVFLMGAAGCPEDGQAKRATENSQRAKDTPKSVDPRIEVITGDKSPAGKLCYQWQLGKKKKYKNHTYTCKTVNRNGIALNVWVG